MSTLDVAKIQSLSVFWKVFGDSLVNITLFFLWMILLKTANVTRSDVLFLIWRK